MDRELMYRFMEVAGLVLAVLAAAGLATGPRRWLGKKAKVAERALARWAWELAAGLVLPLVALGIGEGLLYLPEAVDLAWKGCIPDSHLSAWAMFWLIVAGLNVLETTSLQIAAAAGRIQVPALLRGMLRVVAMALAAFFVLRFEMGWNITPLLASTALVTAVMGFALQGVLGNLLAGMSLNLTGALAHRDWVAIDDLEGRVEEMNWRETWIVTREHIPVRIPNSQVADARLRSLSRPEGPRRCSLFVDASYNDPPDAVLQALLAAAAAVPEVRKNPTPSAYVLDYKNYGVGYELRVWLDDYPFRDPILGEVRRHVWYQFRRAGIDIPYPVTDQVINDFMARAAGPAGPAEDPAAARRAAGLMQSDFARKVLQDAEGRRLVDEAELSEWAGRLTSLLYGRGEILFRQGEAGDCCYVVLSGRLAGRIQHRDAAKETTFEVGPGAVVGEMSLMTGLPRMAEVTVRESAELLRIPAAEFAALLGKHAGLVEQMSRLVAERVQQNRKQFEDLLAADAASRVAQDLSCEGILSRFWRLLGGG